LDWPWEAELVLARYESTVVALETKLSIARTLADAVEIGHSEQEINAALNAWWRAEGIEP